MQGCPHAPSPVEGMLASRHEIPRMAPRCCPGAGIADGLHLDPVGVHLSGRRSRSDAPPIIHATPQPMTSHAIAITNMSTMFGIPLVPGPSHPRLRCHECELTHTLCQGMAMLSNHDVKSSRAHRKAEACKEYRQRAMDHARAYVDPSDCRIRRSPSASRHLLRSTSNR